MNNNTKNEIFDYSLPDPLDLCTMAFFASLIGMVLAIVLSLGVIYL